MIRTMKKVVPSLAIVLLGLVTIYVLAQRTTTFATVGFGLIVALSVGLSLWYQTAARYGATILTCGVMIVVLIARS